MKKIINTLHWIGFLTSCLMLILSALDQSKDEVIIHFIASMIPITLTWLLACFFNGKRNFLPFW
ncbi:MAG: hypothetical protein ACJZ1P_04250 [Candidatus Neomarinimicrobiota bacterium]